MALAVRAEDEVARFQLEKITVTGAREAAGRIVAAETLLRAGESYGEAELAQAVARVQRLPFVLAAEFSLRKGGARGTYELVIEVEEARRFFFDHTVRGTWLAQPLDLDDSVTFDEESVAVSLPGLIGLRRFIGRSGVVFAGLDSAEGLQLGFTRYDLFGRGVVVSAGVSGLLADICCAEEVLPFSLDPSFVSWTWEDAARYSVELGVPLNRTDALRLGASRRTGEGGSRRELFGTRFRFLDGFVDAAPGSDLTLDRAELKWGRDTSDDPLLPHRGSTLSAGLEWTSFTTGALQRKRLANLFTPEPLPAQEAEQLAAVISGRHHWAVTPRQTVSALGRLSVGRASLHNLPTEDGVLAREELDTFAASLGARHAVRLRRERGAQGFGDVLLESTVEVGFESTTPDLQPSRAPNPLERLEISTGLVFRNAWGRLRFVATYLDLGEVLR